MMFLSFMLVIFSLIGAVLSITHNIIPSTNHPCPTNNCLTLSQFYARTNSYLQDNTTVFFQSGNYIVEENLTISHISNFSMLSNSAESASRVTITCNVGASISFRAIRSVHISGLNLEYVGLEVNLVNQFLVEDCIFARYKQSSMQFYNSSVSISETLFTSNSVGSYQGLVSLLNYPVKLAVGGALSISESNVTVSNSTFEKNRAGAGGAIFSNLHSNLTVYNSTFRENTVHCFDCIGGVMYAENGCSIKIYNSTFQDNSAVKYGGVIAVTSSTVEIQFSTFVYNKAGRGGVIYASESTNNMIIVHSHFSNNSANVSGGVIADFHSRISISSCNFTGNQAGTYAGVLDVVQDIVFIDGSIFMNNSAVEYGGVFLAVYVSISINNTEFYRNTAGIAGVLYSSANAEAIVHNCKFRRNAAKLYGGAIFAHDSAINISTSNFAYNNAHSGAVMLCEANTVFNLNGTTIENNTASQGVLYCSESNVLFSNNVNLSGNRGSLFLYYSKMYFRGNTTFISNSFKPNSKERASLYNEGGAITTFQSEIYFETDYQYNIKKNRAERGGGIFAIASKFFISGDLYLMNNTASVSGGGIYLYQSELNGKGKSRIEIIGNSATERGGGLHAISSIITAEYNYVRYEASYSGSRVLFVENMAGKAGGGVCLEVNTKINILNVNAYNSNEPLIYTLKFIQNSADYGGAVYVSDNTNLVTCMGSLNEVHSTTTECFLQTLHIVFRVEVEGKITVTTPAANFTNTLFVGNHAYSRGSTLYGGLLDRCTPSPYIKREGNPFDADKADKNTTFNGVTYFKSTTTITDINSVTVSSDPIQLCFCRSGQPDCAYQPELPPIKKGENFTVSLVAVDQVKNVVSAIVYSRLSSNESGIGEGQLFQNVSDTCTELNFNVFSPHDKEELILYADGPCKDTQLSQRRIKITFNPCTCSIGFQPTSDLTATKCTCECDIKLTKRINNLKCDPLTETLERDFNFWIDYISGDNDSIAGYLFHTHCPLDYCKSASSKVKINLNTVGGSDAQCANNRHGLLCGSCNNGFSLSLGSSSCITCSNYWPAILIVILLAALVSGLGLVAMLLVLNMTVAVGSLNGIIFYANIVAASGSTFFQISKPTFASVFIAWLNLDFGIDACFFKGLNAYWKTWLQLCFPLYVIFLVVMVIIVSEKSKRFSNLIGKKDPVATLATLILLSYAKLLHTAITVLSSAVLVYPNGKTNTVWLSDATVDYFKREHIPLFLTAFFIILLGIAYTLTLFSWQWILRFNESQYLKWTRNQKLSHFIVTYHAPYTPLNRYWTGLLLLVRVILYIASTANVSRDPKLDLLIIGSGITGVLLLMKLVTVSSQVYKKWPIEFIEVVCYVNLIVLCLSLFFSEEDQMKNQVINFSVSVTFILLVGILFYHVYTEIICPKLCTIHRDRESPPESDCDQTDKFELTNTVVHGPIRRELTKYDTELREALIESDDESVPTY